MPHDPILPEHSRQFLDDDLTDLGVGLAPDRIAPTRRPVVAPPRASSSTHSSSMDDDSRARLGRGRGGGRVLAWVAQASLASLLAVAAAVLLAGWLIGREASALNPFHDQIGLRTNTPVLTSLKNLKTFHAAQGYYEVVIDQTKTVTNLPAALAGDRVLFVAAGTVDATVNFAALGANAVSINADRTQATIKLPAPQIGKATLDLEHSYIADHQRGLRERIKDALGSSTSSEVDTKELYTAAEAKLSDAGQRTTELRTRAQGNTVAMLTALLNSLGYTQVTITFAADPAS